MTTSDTMSEHAVVYASPNVMAFTWRSDDGETQWTLYRTTPGDTGPRLQHVITATGQVFDDGPIVTPERFGPHGTTARQFAAWCAKFTSLDFV
jgi:hypothetical protein